MKGFFINILLLIVGTALGQHTVTRLPYPVNTRDYDEICPVFDVDESRIFYTKVGNQNFNKTLIYDGEDLSERLNGEEYEEKLSNIYQLISGRYEESPVQSSFNQDIWYTIKDGGNYKVYHPGYPLNDALPNSICSIFGEDNSYVLINQFFEKGGMREGFSTIKLDQNNSSSFPQPFTIRDFDRISSEINLTMSIDKQIIIMAMQNAYRKDKDLYMSIKINDTLYSSPILLEGVNTNQDETTPFISRDKTKIYFASDREGGNGGLDLYYSDRLDYSYKKWSAPKTYNAFLNTPANESHPFVTLDEQRIYYTSDQLESSDIYFANLVRDILHTPITVKISVIKEETNKNFPAELYWGNTFAEEKWPNFRRVRDGYHEIVIDQNEPIDFKAENRSLKSQIITIDPQELQDKGITEYFVELILTKDGIIKKTGSSPTEEAEVAPELDLELIEGKQVVLKNIYFKRAKPDVVPESFASLKILAKVIKSRPSLVIRVEGHTDNIGDKDALLDLSRSRASAIKSFLKSQGVPDYQVEVIGYGGTQPLTDNSTEAHRRKNRRVEIRVIKQ